MHIAKENEGSLCTSQGSPNKTGCVCVRARVHVRVYTYIYSKREERVRGEEETLRKLAHQLWKLTSAESSVCQQPRDPEKS